MQTKCAAFSASKKAGVQSQSPPTASALQCSRQKPHLEAAVAAEQEVVVLRRSLDARSRAIRWPSLQLRVQQLPKLVTSLERLCCRLHSCDRSAQPCQGQLQNASPPRSMPRVAVASWPSKRLHDVYNKNSCRVHTANTRSDEQIRCARPREVDASCACKYSPVCRQLLRNVMDLERARASVVENRGQRSADAERSAL